MDLFTNLEIGFSAALTWTNLLYCLLGVSLGTFIGVLPGVGPLVTIAVLLPLTFGLPTLGALVMLAGIYYGAQYGGSTTSILVNLPGESSSVVTCIDGYQMARKGRAGPALAIAAIGSFVAGCLGTVINAFAGPKLAGIALQFTSPEYFSLMVLAMVSSAALVHGSLLSGIAMAHLGILFSLIGNDVNSGVPRFTLGISDLFEGIDFVVVAMGLFAFGEIISNLEQNERREVFTAKISGLMPTLADLKASWKPILRGTAVGSALGVLPGAGVIVSSFASYVLEKRLAKDPSRFGQGAIEGVAAPESANNAAAQTAFIPMLTLGIPGTATMALMLGALSIHNITPGPEVINQQPELFWGLIASMWIGNLLLLVLNLPLVGIWVSMLRIPYKWLYPAILVFSCLGTFSISNNALDVLLAALFGLFGYVLIKLRCEVAPFILGYVLGPMLEENFRRSMTLARGDATVFLQRPISATFLAVAVVFILAMLVPAIRRKKEEAVVPD